MYIHIYILHIYTPSTPNPLLHVGSTCSMWDLMGDMASEIPCGPGNPPWEPAVSAAAGVSPAQASQVLPAPWPRASDATEHHSTWLISSPVHILPPPRNHGISFKIDACYHGISWEYSQYSLKPSMFEATTLFLQHFLSRLQFDGKMSGKLKLRVKRCNHLATPAMNKEST